MKIIPIIILTFLFISCTSENNQPYLSLFDPYSKGDVLIFRSSEGELDTATILKAVGSEKSRDVAAIHSLDNPVNENELSVSGMLLLLRFEDGEYVYFGFRGKHMSESVSTQFKIQELDSIKPVTVRVDADYYTDVLQLKSSGNFSPNRDTLTKILWSKRYGFIVLEIDGSESWTLIKRLKK